MGVFGRVVGQPRAVAFLERVVREGASHAYLFAGPQGTGKEQAAYAFAAALLCPERGCGRCEVCRRALTGVHPDLVVVRRKGRFILVDQVREEVILDALLKPYEAPVRVYVVLEADTMDTEAGNALLKLLEEPPAHVHFILVSSGPERLLPTIISRCQRVPFVPVAAEPLARSLQAVYGLSEQDSLALARVVQGDFSYAQALAESETARTARVRLVSFASQLPGATLQEQVAIVDELVAPIERRERQAVDLVEKERSAVLEWVGNARERARATKEFSERASREKWAARVAGVDEITRTFASWYRDLAAVASGAEETVHNVDYLDELKLQALPGLLDGYLAAVEVAKRARARFSYNVDVRCTMEDMVFALKEAFL